MPKAIDDDIVEVVDHIWRENREKSSLAIWGLADGKLEGECPSPKWVYNRVRILKATVHPLVDPIIKPWSKNWPTDPDRVKTLLVMHHEAMSLCDSRGMGNFRGLTDRMARWACKIANFFDLSIRLDRIMLLQFSIWFAGLERWGEERRREEREGPANLHAATISASSGLMAWHRWDPDVHSARARWGHVSPIWEMWAERKDIVEQIVSDHLAGHIESITSSEKTIPIFDQHQLDDLERAREQHNREFYKNKARREGAHDDK